MKESDISYAKKRKRMWDVMGFGYTSWKSLSKRHSLNCGCNMCKAMTFYKRLGNKQKRLKERAELRELV